VLRGVSIDSTDGAAGGSAMTRLLTLPPASCEYVLALKFTIAMEQDGASAPRSSLERGQSAAREGVSQTISALWTGNILTQKKLPHNLTTGPAELGTLLEPLPKLVNTRRSACEKEH
jgi:hypothetical protein